MDINPINDATAKVFIAWGLQGAIILVQGYVIYWLFGKLSASQEQRVVETKEMLTKYELLVDKVHDTLDQLTSVLGRKRGK